jgi:hypothetical protein
MGKQKFFLGDLGLEDEQEHIIVMKPNKGEIRFSLKYTGLSH